MMLGRTKIHFPLFLAGLVALAFAISMLVLQWGRALPMLRQDLAQGLFFGIAIGLLILALRGRSKPNPIAASKTASHAP
jgi:hypothetical protein